MRSAKNCGTFSGRRPLAKRRVNRQAPHKKVDFSEPNRQAESFWYL
jgi:hypothetical protein